ncbi:MAG: helix-turn-helix domain-containing protein, partial [Gemmatimonadota bacterium]
NAVVDVRFLAATNKDPAAAVREGSLRSDLYYRLRVVPINMPPLRQRLEDIPVLANHFLVHYWHRDHDGETPPTLSDDALRALRSYSWPGNIRELQNVIEHTAVLTPPGADIGGLDIPFPDDQIGEEVTPLGTDPSLFQEEYHVARDRLLDEFERRYVTELVNRADGNMSKAARLAGVDRTTLYRLIDKHGLEREAILRDS